MSKAPCALLPFLFLAAPAVWAKDKRVEVFDPSRLDAQRALIEQEVYQAEGPRFALQSTGCAVYYEKHYPYSYELGDQKFGAAFASDAFAIFDCNGARTGADAAVKGTVFEQRFPLADLTAHVEASRKLVTFEASFYVMGFEVDQSHMEGAGEIRMSGRPHYVIDEENHWDGAIGPVPVTIKYGVAGLAELPWQVWGNLMEAKVETLPKVTAAAYIEGGLGSAQVAALVVGGQMTVLDENFAATAGVEIGGTDSQPEIVAKAYVENNWQALDGTLNGSVTLLNHKIFSREFFNWDGIKLHQVIFDEEEHVPFKLPKAAL